MAFFERRSELIKLTELSAAAREAFGGPNFLTTGLNRCEELRLLSRCRVHRHRSRHHHHHRAATDTDAETNTEVGVAVVCCATIAPVLKPDRSERQNIRSTFIYTSLSDRSGRNRGIRVRGGDELGTDRNQRVLTQPVRLAASERQRPSRLYRHSKSGRRNQSAVSAEFFPSFTRRSFPTGIRDGGRREPREPQPCSLGERNVCRDLAAVGIPRHVQESPVRSSNEGALGCNE